MKMKKCQKHQKNPEKPLMKQHMKVSVYQATHNQICKKSADYLVPIQVGAALTSERYAAVRDNIGENISEKNPYYCELTALYWVWKNDKTSDIIGLCHYRRKFPFHRAKKIEQKLLKYDAIVTSPYGFRMSLKEEYAKFHERDDLRRMLMVLKRCYPMYMEAAQSVLCENQLIPYNMIILSRNQYDSYCEWLFSILGELEKNGNDIERDIYQARYFGFLAERLMNIYIVHHRWKVLKVHPVLTEHRWMTLVNTLSTMKNNLIFGGKKILHVFNKCNV